MNERSDEAEFDALVYTKLGRSGFGGPEAPRQTARKEEGVSGYDALGKTMEEDSREGG